MFCKGNNEWINAKFNESDLAGCSQGANVVRMMKWSMKLIVKWRFFIGSNECTFAKNNEIMIQLMKYCNEWNNKWMNEWNNEWINESMVELMNDWNNDCINEWINEWINDTIN